MCITEDKLVESYGKATPRERFRLIYKNYSIFPQLVDCYETGLFNRILFEVEYNRRKKNDDDLGVRIQTSHRHAAARQGKGIHLITPPPSAISTSPSCRPAWNASVPKTTRMSKRV